MYQERKYRNLIPQKNLVSFQVVVKETDLWIQADRNLAKEARELVLRYRGYIESYIQAYPEFFKTLVPWNLKTPAPKIITEMVNAGSRAGVGPMAAVAGAVAESVGIGLLKYSDEVVVENGGDIFVKLNHPVVSSVYTRESSAFNKLGVRVPCSGEPMGICTSSGRIGHSFSRGVADAVCVISKSCSLSDAAATAICNQVDSKDAVEIAIDFGKQIPGLTGIIIIAGDRFGAWGDIEILKLTN